MDRLRLKEMTLFPQLGVTAWEKKGVNKVAVDLDLYLDLSDAARQDRVNSTVDYSEVYAVVVEVSKSRKYHLIESLTHEIIDALLFRFPLLSRVHVRLRKANLPFDANLDYVEVSLDRSRIDSAGPKLRPPKPEPVPPEPGPPDSGRADSGRPDPSRPDRLR